MSTVLYQFPSSCSRVILAALEEIGLPFEDKGVNLMGGEQAKPAYRALNPKGKVPVLVVDGHTITEVPAILFYLDGAYPDAKLLAGSGPAAKIDALSDLIWTAGFLHPLVTRMFRPTNYSAADAAGVKALAAQLLAEQAVKISPRLADGRWWAGETWSMMDVFVQWVFWAGGNAGFPIGDYPILVEHAARVTARPAFERAVERERASVPRDKIDLIPGMVL